MSNSSVTLQHPITLTVGGEEKVISELTLRRPKLKDLKDLNTSEMDTDSTIKLISRLSGLSAFEVSEIDMADMASINEILGDFFTAPAA